MQGIHCRTHIPGTYYIYPPPPPLLSLSLSVLILLRGRPCHLCLLGVHETPGTQCAVVARNLLMLTEIIEQSESITIWHLRCISLSLSLRHSLSSEVINYVHTKGCIGFCIRNIKLSVDQPPLDLVEIFATIFCCLKDSSDMSQVCAVPCLHLI